MTRNQYSGTPFEEVLQEFHDDPYLSAMLQDTVDRQELLADLRQIRVEKNLRQADVAKSMKTSQSTVSELEGEGDDVYLSTIQRYATAVGAELVIRVQKTGADAFAGYPRAVDGERSGAGSATQTNQTWTVTTTSDDLAAAQ